LNRQTSLGWIAKWSLSQPMLIPENNAQLSAIWFACVPFWIFYVLLVFCLNLE